MTPKALNTRLLFNFWSLLLALALAALATWLAALCYQYFPSYSAEGSAWGSLDDGLSIMVLGMLFFLIAIVWWTIRVVLDIVRHREHSHFVWGNVLLLGIFYAVVVGYLWSVN